MSYIENARFDRLQAEFTARHNKGKGTDQASPLTEEQPTYRHKKRGTDYVLIGFGKMQAEDWCDTEAEGPDGGYPSVDMREVAIYRSATDPTEMWVRPREEFDDGRFEPLPRSTTGGAK